MYRIVFSIFMCLLTGSASFAGSPTTSVVVSIKPLALVANELVEGTGVQVDTLLPAHISEHGYSLRVSDIQSLQKARLVIWMGEKLEPYLASSKDSWLSPANARKSLTLLEAEADSHEAHASHNLHHGDPHRWLDPQQTIQLAQMMADRLILIFPEHSHRISDNLGQFVREVGGQDDRWQKVFEPYKNRPFVVVHDAYSHWARHYGLRQLGVIYSGSGSLRGAKNQAVTQNSISREPTRVCLFVEPQLNSSSLPPAFGATNKLRRRVLDPLGINAQSYTELIETLNQEALACFKD